MVESLNEMHMTKMTHKERFLSAINHEQADQVPTYAFKSENGFNSAYEDKYEDRDFDWVHFYQDQTIIVDLKIDATTEPGLGDMMDPDFGFKSFKTPEGYSVGPNGRSYKTASDGRSYYQDGHWTSKEVRYEKFPKRIPRPQSEFDLFEKFYNETVIRDDKIYVFPIINGLHEGNWLSLGIKTFGKELRKPTGLLDSTLDDLQKVNIETCKRLLDIDSEMVIGFTDDIAQKGRLMMAPKHFQKYYLPRYKELFDMIHKRGGRTMIHTDGKIDELIPYYIEMGLDMLQALEPAAGVDIIELNEKFGDKISWNGNIDVSVLLWKGTPSEVRAQSEKIVRAVAPSNNIAFGPCTDIMAWHPVDNIETMYETARAYDYKTKKFDN
jgi:uroporphyrinogen-III decarboxylase